MSERVLFQLESLAVEPGSPPECSLSGWYNSGNEEQAWRGNILFEGAHVGTLTCGIKRPDVAAQHPVAASAVVGFMGHIQLPFGMAAGPQELTLQFVGRWGRVLGEVKVPISLEEPVPATLVRPAAPRVDDAHPGAPYLDLMVRSLLGLPYASDSESLLRLDGRDWPVVAHTMVGEQRLSSLRACVEAVLREQVPGDMVETGVWKGGACILMRAVLEAYGDAARKVWVADSFSGLPVPDPEKYPADTGDTHHLHAELAVPLEAVQENFRRYNLLDERVVFLQGWFEDTLPVAPIESIAVLRLDGDMYSSTIEALTNLYPKLVPGGFCIIDDYGAVPSCRLAVRDYRAAHGITEPITLVDWTGAWWRKAGTHIEIAPAPSIVDEAGAQSVAPAALSIPSLPEGAEDFPPSAALPIPVGRMLTREPHLLTGLSAWQQHIPFAFWAVEHLRPRTIVELGVHTGPSYCAFCQAVVETGVDARCYGVDTWMGDPHAGLYGDDIFNTLSRYQDPLYGGFSTLVRSSFEVALTHFEDGSIDLLHIDGAHFYEDVKQDFESWLPKMSSRGVILFHDTNVRERNFGVAKLWSEIHGRYESFQFYHGHGLGVLCVGSSLSSQFAQWFGNEEKQAVVRRVFASLGSRLPLRAKLDMANAAVAAAMAATPPAGATSALQHELDALRENALVRERLWQGEKDLLLTGMQKEASRAKWVQRRALEGSAMPRWKAVLLLATRRRLRKQKKKLAASGLFDESWYLSRLPKSIRPADPLLHYLRVGWKLGVSPHRLFDVSAYSESYSKKLKGREPLTDYVENGAKTGRNPHLLFDAGWYKTTQMQQGDGAGNPLHHYLSKGAEKDLWPHALFDGAWYRRQYAGDIPAGMTPLEHYLDGDNAWMYQPNEWFDSRWYGKQHLGKSRVYASPLHHYLALGGKFTLSTHPEFDAAWYRRTHMTETDRKRLPLEHLLHVGKAKGYAASGCA